MSIWRKTDEGWRLTKGEFIAEVRKPSGPLGFCHWSVRCGDNPGGSGGTSSPQQTKRAASAELERFKAFLSTKPRGRSP